MLEGVVFDCDGTLVNSEQQVIAIEQRMFRDLGWEATVEEIAARFVGKAGVEYQAAVHEVLGPLPDNWREPYEEELEYALSNGLCPTDGIIEALRGIRLPMAVASNSAHSRVERSLDLTGSRHFFGGRVVGIDDVDRGKPAPDPYLRAAELLGANPERCVAVEDSPTGVTSAREAGMTVLGYAGALTPGAVLREAGAQVFTDMRQLPELIERIGVD